MFPVPPQLELKHYSSKVWEVRIADDNISYASHL